MDNETTSNSTFIHSLPLSLRTKNCLINGAGQRDLQIFSYEDMCKIDPLEYFKMKNLGRKSLNEIVQMLDGLGFTYSKRWDYGYFRNRESQIQRLRRKVDRIYALNATLVRTLDDLNETLSELENSIK